MSHGKVIEGINLVIPKWNCNDTARALFYIHPVSLKLFLFRAVAGLEEVSFSEEKFHECYSYSLVSIVKNPRLLRRSIREACLCRNKIRSCYVLKTLAPGKLRK